MVYQRGKLKDQASNLVQARKWGFGLIIGMVGAAYFVSEVKRLNLQLSDPLVLSYLSLLATVVGLIFMWFWATHKELDMLLEWLDPVEYAVPSSSREVLTIMGMAVILGGLMFAARDPLYFGALYSVFALVTPIAESRVYRQLREAVEGSRKRAEKDLSDPKHEKKARLYISALDVICGYFLNRPHPLRHWVTFAFSLAGFGLALWSKLGGHVYLSVASYANFVLLIVTAEVILFSWRNTRDDSLRMISAKLSELDRASDLEKSKDA